MGRFFPIAVYVILIGVGIAIQRPAHKPGPRPPASRDVFIYAPVLASHVGSLLAPPLEALIEKPPFDPFRFSLGALLFLVALAIRGVAIRALGDKYVHQGKYLDTFELVADGIYKYIRHPIYFSNLLLAVACPLMLSAKYSYAFSALYILFTVVGMFREESRLAARFPEYRRYASKTKRFIPGLF